MALVFTASSTCLPHAGASCPGRRCQRGAEGSGGEPLARTGCCGKSMTGAGECLLSDAGPHAGGSCGRSAVPRRMRLPGPRGRADVPRGQPPGTCFHIRISAVLAAGQGSRCCTACTRVNRYRGQPACCLCSLSRWSALIFLEKERYSWRDDVTNPKEGPMGGTAHGTDGWVFFS